jgi:dihydrofolate synthase/folylpolyglutamate synthase
MVAYPVDIQSRDIETIRQEILPKYYDALHWLHSFIAHPEGNPIPRSVDRTSADQSASAEKLALHEDKIHRMEILLSYLGNPQDAFRSVHVAGTGGKGSTATMIGKILEGSFARVGVRTSPYLQVPGEKLRINGRMIAPSRFARVVDSLRPRYEAFRREYPHIKTGYKSVHTAFYYSYFAESHLDWGVIETMMGGRFDFTNVLNPELSVITNVDFDHVPALGTTLAEIAWHKAGIIKRGKPAITGELEQDALAVIRQEAAEKGAELYCQGKDFDWEMVSLDDRGATINVSAPFQEYRNIRIPLLGSFQAQNAGLAIAAVDLLAHNHNFSMTSDIANRTLADIQFPGRMEIIQENPRVILDGAHNPQKMLALSKSIAQLYPNTSFTLICGMLCSKDTSQSLKHLLSQSRRVVTVKPQVLGRACVEASDLAGVVRDIGYAGPIDTFPDVTQALDTILAEAKPDDMILVTGSLYMLGEARSYWVSPESLLIESELAEDSLSLQLVGPRALQLS